MTTMGGSLQVAAGIVTLATLGTAWLQARRKGSARGWCAKCNAPDLWIRPQETPVSRILSAAAWAHCVAPAALIGVAVGGLGSESMDALMGLTPFLGVSALLLAGLSRSKRGRLVACDTCGAQSGSGDVKASSENRLPTSIGRSDSVIDSSPNGHGTPTTPRGRSRVR